MQNLTSEFFHLNIIFESHNREEDENRRDNTE